MNGDIAHAIENAQFGHIHLSTLIYPPLKIMIAIGFRERIA